jgi:hypothetical protein
MGNNLDLNRLLNYPGHGLNVLYLNAPGPGITMLVK